MRCPKCDFEQPDGLTECRRCGVIFGKIRVSSRPVLIAELQHRETGSSHPVHRGLWPTLKALLTATQPDESALFILGRAAVLALMLIWGWRFILAPLSSGYAAETPLHLVHLPFHEAGHVIFGILGIRFLTVLGGTLGQLLVPAVIIAAFLLHRNPFGACVGLWWLGQSLMDVAVYADDARAGQLPLLGGVTGSEVEGYHDWEVMLGKLGWLPYDHLIARLFFVCGSALIVAAVAWGALLLRRQWQVARGCKI
jgi:hypothetical protein